MVNDDDDDDDDDDDFCNICLGKTDVQKYDDRLLVCTRCLSEIKRLEKQKENKPKKLPKEQVAGGTKDEL